MHRRVCRTHSPRPPAAGPPTVLHAAAGVQDRCESGAMVHPNEAKVRRRGRGRGRGRGGGRGGGGGRELRESRRIVSVIS